MALNFDEFTVETTHINVGAGDSTLIVLKRFALGARTIERAVLIDGGPSSGGKYFKSCLEETFQETKDPFDPTRRYINAIVTSHFDSDHYEGIARLLKEELQRNKNDEYFRYLS